MDFILPLIFANSERTNRLKKDLKEGKVDLCSIRAILVTDKCQPFSASEFAVNLCNTHAIDWAVENQ